ncbi:MAG: type II 3-dehydroquinate dehydratase [Mycobacteriales bacterium]
MNPVYVLNGPNLGRLGTREPEIYGTQTYPQLVAMIERHAARLELTVDVRQTDDEATLVGYLHEASDTAAAVILNPAAFTHYSIAVRDAAAMIGVPLIEVHLSNTAAREEFRKHSVISDVATGTIAGFGAQSYLLALDAVASLLGPQQPDA